MKKAWAEKEEEEPEEKSRPGKFKNVMKVNGEVKSASNLIPGVKIERKASSTTSIAGEEALKKLENVQSLLRQDSKGDLIEPADMNLNGRYRKHNSTDPAFQKVHLTVLIEDLPMPSLSSLKHGKHQVRRHTVLTTAADLNKKQLRATEEEDEDNDDEGEELLPSKSPFPTIHDLSPPASTSLLPPPALAASPLSPDAQKKKVKANTGLAFGAISKLGKWKSKTKKTSRKGFAKSEAHYNLMMAMSNKFSIDTPLPMKIMMFEEMFAVVQETVTAYEEQLGKNHPMSVQAKDKVQELYRWGNVLCDI